MNYPISFFRPSGLILVMAMISLILIWQTFKSFQFLIDLQENRFKSYEITNELRFSSDQLTQTAQAYVVTGDVRFKTYFNEILDIRHGRAPRPKSYNRYMWHLDESADDQKYEAVAPMSVQDMMKDLNFTGQELSLLRISQRRSDWLSVIETETMASVDRIREVNHTIRENNDNTFLPAIESLFSKRYFEDKAAIMAPLQAIYESVDARTQQGFEAATVKLRNLLIADSVMLTMLICGVMILNYRHHVSSTIAALQAKAKLRQYDDDFLYTTQKYNEAVRALNKVTANIPICSDCQKIRFENASWAKFERFVAENPQKFHPKGRCVHCSKNAMRVIGLDNNDQEGAPPLFL